MPSCLAPPTCCVNFCEALLTSFKNKISRYFSIMCTIVLHLFLNLELQILSHILFGSSLKRVSCGVKTIHLWPKTQEAANYSLIEFKKMTEAIASFKWMNIVRQFESEFSRDFSTDKKVRVITS